MSYIDGFVAAVPQENKQAYLDHAREALSLFKDHGAARMVENWGDDVPEGKVTDFHRSVRKKDERGGALQLDRMAVEGCPQRRHEGDDGGRANEDARDAVRWPRMIFGGFTPIVEEGAAAGTGYADGFVVPVPGANREAYTKLASERRACLRRIWRHPRHRSLGR